MWRLDRTQAVWQSQWQRGRTSLLGLCLILGVALHPHWQVMWEPWQIVRQCQNTKDTIILYGILGGNESRELLALELEMVDSVWQLCATLLYGYVYIYNMLSFVAVKLIKYMQHHSIWQWQLYTNNNTVLLKFFVFLCLCVKTAQQQCVQLYTQITYRTGCMAAFEWMCNCAHARKGQDFSAMCLSLTRPCPCATYNWLLHPAPTSVQDGLDPQQPALVFSCHQIAQRHHLHLLWTSPATCAGGVFLAPTSTFTNVHTCYHRPLQLVYWWWFSFIN